VEPKQGNHVYLTIDARMQYVVERALRDAGVGRAAAVVVDPTNGEILAMASVPSYDPNVFIPNISREHWQQITKDETDPLTNRAIQGYAPGSTYKAVSGLAGLKKGLTAKNTFACAGGVSYGAKFMKCWVVDRHLPPHGSVGLSDALKFSCNAFFYQWGNAAGIDQIVEVGEALGLGQRSGLPLSGEDAGILPSPEWLRVVSPQERWSNGYTANVSIGQGAVEASPVQMCMVAAAVANGGLCFAPKLVSRVVDEAGNDVVNPETGEKVVGPMPKLRADLRALGISDEQIELIRRGMWKVVNEPGGTGKKAQVKGMEVAGKTGTAQFWREVAGKKERDNHTWFMCFAPYNSPRFAVTVFVQGAKSGGAVSAPIAQRILEQCSALANGYDPGLSALQPALGSFQQIDEVNYKSGPIFGTESQADRETADHAEPAAKPSKKNTASEAQPDIKPEADARGRFLKSRQRSNLPRKEVYLRDCSGLEKSPRPNPPLHLRDPLRADFQCFLTFFQKLFP
jgi:penicillin-binding protein 2